MSSKLGFKTLLVAIDGSKHSEKVVETACDLGKLISRKILLVFVSPFKEVEKEYEHYAKVQDTGIEEYYRAVGDAVLSKLEAKIKHRGLECEILFEVGNPAAEIINIANERKAGMIILGLHGLHGVAHLRTLGSVARRVVENSICPVVIVP